MRTAQITTLLTVFALTGCASNGFEKALASHHEGQASLDKAEAKMLETPLLDLKLGPNGQLLGLTVGRQGSTRMATAAPTDPTLAVWGKALDGLTAVGGIVAGGAAAKGLATAVGTAAGRGYKYIQSPTVVTPQANITTPTTNTLNGTGVMGSGTFSAPVTTTLSGTGVIGSGNYTASTLSGTGTQGGGAYTPVDRHDSYTSTPTVVQIPAAKICSTNADGGTTCQ
jgi:hypothetical protein